jgi:hypothetical protein
LLAVVAIVLSVLLGYQKRGTAGMIYMATDADERIVSALLFHCDVMHDQS